MVSGSVGWIATSPVSSEPTGCTRRVHDTPPSPDVKNDTPVPAKTVAGDDGATATLVTGPPLGPVLVHTAPSACAPRTDIPSSATIQRMQRSPGADSTSL